MTASTTIETAPRDPDFAPEGIRKRVAAYDWSSISTTGDAEGWALLPNLLSKDEADSLSAIYPDETRFRRKVVMAQHGFGRGEYKYLSYPMPALVAALRAAFYPYLAGLGNAWEARLAMPAKYPPLLSEYLDLCAQTGQRECTPSLLSYVAGDYNCLHQDNHGETMFPFQVCALLNQPGEDFEGGQFIMTEQRPRLQTRGMIIEPLYKGDAVLFTASNRPIHGAHGEYQVKMRHGVNKLRSGHRRTLGIMFHDALT
jgi:hypothetical protein